MNVTTAVVQPGQPAASGSAALAGDQGFGAVLDEEIATASQGGSQSGHTDAQEDESAEGSSPDVSSELVLREQGVTADLAAVIGYWSVTATEALNVLAGPLGAGSAPAVVDPENTTPSAAPVLPEQVPAPAEAPVMGVVPAVAVGVQMDGEGSQTWTAPQVVAAVQTSLHPGLLPSAVNSAQPATSAPASAAAEQSLTAADVSSADAGVLDGAGPERPLSERRAVTHEQTPATPVRSEGAPTVTLRSEGGALPVGAQMESPPAVPPAVTIPAPGVTGVQALVAAAPVAPAPPPAAAASPQSLPDQIAPQIASLKSLGDGQHTMTLRVTPESLGPVRVIAHINGEHMRIELVGASEQARDALRSVLTDLRRDLAATTSNATLDLGSNGRGGRQNSENAHSSQAPVDAFDQNPSITPQQPQTGATQTRPAPNRSTGVDLYV